MLPLQMDPQMMVYGMDSDQAVKVKYRYILGRCHGYSGVHHKVV